MHPSSTLLRRVPDELSLHLAASLGCWPPEAGTPIVTTSPRRGGFAPGGAAVAEALRSPHGTVISVPPELVAQAPHAPSDDEVALWLSLALPHEQLAAYAYRWLGPDERVADLDDAGRWMVTDRGPAWLRRFEGDVLVARTGDQRSVAIGIEALDAHACRIAVVAAASDAPAALTHRLVAQATRAVHRRGAVALYRHAPHNDRSRLVADAVGYPDDGWDLLATEA